MSADAPGMPRSTFLLITCEHGGNEAPPEHEALFRDAADVLATHRGLDIGALPVAQRLADRSASPLIFSTTTRLLIDLNRSLDQPDLFSAYSRDLPEPERARIIATHYEPYRTSVRRVIDAAIGAGHCVVHIGVHSCTDVLAGSTRDLDIALLFDPARPLETAFCERWRSELRRHAPDLRYPFNEPYLGSSDGLTTALRTHFPPAAYLGIEVELRQGMILHAQAQRATGDLLAATLPAALTAQSIS